MTYQRVNWIKKYGNGSRKKLIQSTLIVDENNNQVDLLRSDQKGYKNVSRILRDKYNFQVVKEKNSPSELRKEVDDEIEQLRKFNDNNTQSIKDNGKYIS